jgi:hypothetical protein
VDPDTVLGDDPATGEVFYAGCHGRVDSMGFSGAEHAFVVIVTPDKAPA